MRLPIPFLHKNKKSKICYLALLLTSEKVCAVILEELDGKIKILSRRNQLFKDIIENIPLEDLIETADHALSRALEVLPPDIELHKTVFGVKENWLDEESKKIKKAYLQKLKKVCDGLDLAPVGFMVIKEAIVNLIQQEQGAPLSAILVELGGKQVTLTLFRGGRSVQTVEGAMEGSPVLTVNALLNQFTAEVLPARIILYDTNINEALVQQFIKHQWSKILPFLHMPQISVLPEDFESRAIVFGVSQQMGLEVVNNDDTQIKTFDNRVALSGSEDESHESRKGKLNEDSENAPSINIIPSENFGFIVDADIAEVGENHKRPITEINDEEIPSTTGLPRSPSVMSSGSNDLTVARNDKKDQAGNSDEEIKHENVSSETLYEEDSSEHGKKGNIFKNMHLPSISVPSIPSLWLRGIIIPIFILGVIIGGAYYFYFYKVTAMVILTLKPKEVTKNMDIVFASDEDKDFSNNILSAKEVSDTTDGDMSGSATGKKDVGENASGTVTLYNNNIDSDSDLSKGTTIKSENSLSFLLTKDVIVASAAGDVFSGTKPGTAKVDVTAGDIGTKYNLPSGTKFSVAGQASVAGKNDTAFSGGSSKSVTVVSKDDLTKLKNDLLKSLEEKANEALAIRAKVDNTLIPLVLSTDVKTSKYDKNAGDEAKNVKLSATISYTGLSYQINDAKEFAKTLLEKEYGKNKTFNEDTLKINLKNTEKKNQKQVSATLAITVSLLPKIETSEISKKLSGKTRQEVAAILSRYPQLAGTDIVYRPNIFYLGALFPVLPSHVVVTLSSN